MPRPPLPPDEFRKPRHIRMSDKEWEFVATVALADNLSASEFIRRAAIEAALLRAKRGRRR